MSAADAFFVDGCGRCALGGTPACKVHRWTAPLAALRAVLLGCGLVETRKWGVACYTHGGQNVALLSALQDCCTLSWLQGVLLADPHGLLVAPGPNSQAARVLRVTDVAQVEAHHAAIVAWAHAAMAMRARGERVVFQDPKDQAWPAELTAAVRDDPELAAAFARLSAGRQRGYVLHFADAKQAATRRARIVKCRARILAGLGMHDRPPVG